MNAGRAIVSSRRHSRANHEIPRMFGVAGGGGRKLARSHCFALVLIQVTSFAAVRRFFYVAEMMVASGRAGS